MSKFMQWVAVSFVATGLAFGAAACGGGKAGKEDCEKAADNLVKITVDKAMASMGEGVPEDAKKQAAEQAKKAAEQTKTAFVEGCVDKFPGDAVECFVGAADLDAWTACAQKASGG